MFSDALRGPYRERCELAAGAPVVSVSMWEIESRLRGRCRLWHK